MVWKSLCSARRRKMRFDCLVLQMERRSRIRNCFMNCPRHFYAFTLLLTATSLNRQEMDGLWKWKTVHLIPARPHSLKICEATNQSNTTKSGLKKETPFKTDPSSSLASTNCWHCLIEIYFSYCKRVLLRLDLIWIPWAYVDALKVKNLSFAMFLS